MRLIDVDNLIDDCKRYLATLNPDRDGKECTRIHWLIGILNNAPSVNPDTPTNTPDIPTDYISRQVAIEAVEKESQVDGAYGYMDTKNIVDLLNDLPSAQPEPSTEIQEILNYLDTTLHPIVSPDNWYVYAELHDMVSRLPSAQPEPSIPISWIEKQIDWLKSMDNEFSNITAMNISVLVKKWRKENGKENGKDDGSD